MIRAGAVKPHPEVVAGPTARGADVGVGVVPIDSPGGQHPLGEAIFSGPADVVHDLVPPTVGDRFANPARDVVERLVPGDLHPAAFAPLPRPLQWMEDAVGIGDLVQCGRALGAVTPS